MRTKKDILNECNTSQQYLQSTKLIVEVLVDIRDLLKKFVIPKNKDEDKF